MKKLLLGIFVAACLLISFASVQTAMAQEFDPLANACTGVPTTGDDKSSVCADKVNNTLNPLTGNEGIIIKAVRVIALLTGMASVIVGAIAGFKYITSNGDTNSINSAKNTILYAIIGVVVSLMSQAIILFVINKVN